MLARNVEIWHERAESYVNPPRTNSMGVALDDDGWPESMPVEFRELFKMGDPNWTPRNSDLYQALMWAKIAWREAVFFLKYGVFPFGRKDSGRP